MSASPPAVKRRAAASAAVHIRGTRSRGMRTGRGRGAAGGCGTGHGVAWKTGGGGASGAVSVSEPVSSMLVEVIIPGSDLARAREGALAGRDARRGFRLSGDVECEPVQIGLDGGADSAIGATGRLLDHEHRPRIQEYRSRAQVGKLAAGRSAMAVQPYVRGSARIADGEGDVILACIRARPDPGQLLAHRLGAIAGRPGRVPCVDDRGIRLAEVKLAPV